MQCSPPRALFSTAILASLSFMAACTDTIAGEPKGPLAGFAVARDWSDASQKFKVQAKLQFADDQEAHLLKDDGKIIKVPFAKLSEPDRAFVDSFLKAEAAMKAAGALPSDDAENPFAGGEKSDRGVSDRKGSMRDKKDSSSSEAASSGELAKRPVNDRGMKQVTITPSKDFWSVPSLRGFPDVQFEDLIVQTPLPKPFFASMRAMAAGKSGNVLLNTYQQGRGGKENFSKFVLVQGTTGDASSTAEFGDPWKLMAMSLDGTRAAAVRIEGFDKGNDVAIFKVSADGLVPDFQFTAGGGSWDELHYVAFLPGNQLVTISQKSNLTFWDLDATPGPKALRRGNSGGAMSAEMSPAGEVMAIIMASSIAVVDTSSGKMVGCIRNEQAVSKVAFSSDAQSLAVFRPFQVTVYGVQDGKQINAFAVSEAGAQADFYWVGNQLMVGSIAYDAQSGVPLWTYQSNPAARTTLGSYLISAFGNDNESSVTLFRIPHEEAVRAGASVDPKTIYAIVPGDAVAVRYQLGNLASDVQQAVRQSMEAKIQELGWVLQPQAANTIDVAITQGKQEEAEYFNYQGFGPGSMFAPPGFGRANGPGTKVQYTPWNHSITIQTAGKTIFTSQYQRGAPHNLETKDGESTQQGVTRFCQPFPAFFKTAAIPPHLLKIEYQGGLGKSTIDASGMH